MKVHKNSHKFTKTQKHQFTKTHKQYTNSIYIAIFIDNYKKNSQTKSVIIGFKTYHYGQI
jgi:hypothetical protein